MPKHIAAIAIAFLAVVTTAASQTPAASSAREIDRDVWAAFVATVAADDIVGMGRVYVPDAVLVTPTKTQAIKDTLEGWGRDMVAAKARGDKATVEFRFS